jgi:hypothetical protein
MTSFGPLNEEFSELELEDPFPVELNERGKIILQLRRKVVEKTEIPFKRLDRTCFNGYPQELIEEWEVPGYIKPNWSNFYFHANYMKSLVEKTTRQSVLPSNFAAYTKGEAKNEEPQIEDADTDISDDEHAQDRVIALEQLQDKFGNNPEKQQGDDWSTVMNDSAIAGIREKTEGSRIRKKWRGYDYDSHRWLEVASDVKFNRRKLDSSQKATY